MPSIELNSRYVQCAWRGIYGGKTVFVADIVLDVRRLPTLVLRGVPQLAVQDEPDTLDHDGFGNRLVDESATRDGGLKRQAPGNLSLSEVPTLTLI